ncbi:gas vesicle protein [Moorena producens PAL-8-15-08-1]|uniref:Gas vesicle protein n=1 Tax=Moorena producens PAL-8-15-08-1 TaxID=1458985 RepID=A0A1D8TXI6_9CYAN|nr:YtxH domain-containing protein [Moorena producens]AOX02370.1 gas vesicle protein [Moorena producens PAL-8-15-08-1]
MSKKSAGAFIGGMLLGSAVGTVVGLLIAPRTGRDTRKLLKKSADALPELAEDLSSSVQLQADRLSDSTLRNWDDTLARLKVAIAAGLEASVPEKVSVAESVEPQKSESAVAAESNSSANQN